MKIYILLNNPWNTIQLFEQFYKETKCNDIEDKQIKDVCFCYRLKLDEQTSTTMNQILHGDENQILVQ